MTNNKKVLIVGTYGIDVFYGLLQALKDIGFGVDIAETNSTARHSLSATRYAAVLVNLEPDGKGGIEGIDVLSGLLAHRNQKDAVCFGISAQNPSTLLVSSSEKLSLLSVLAGWLTLPIHPEKAANLIKEICQDPGKLTLSSRSPKVNANLLKEAAVV